MEKIMTTETNPKISSLLRFLTFVEVVVLFLAGFGLFLAPKLVTPLWPWELLPFNARFLGAVYAASCIAAIMRTAYARWSPARLVTPMIFIFTTVIIVLSFVYFSQFDFQRWEVWVWFFLYIILPINAAYHLWLYRNLPPANSTPPAISTRNILSAEAVVLGLYGLALIFIPSIAKMIWSWEIDTFHAQLYSVTFLTPALGAYILTKGGTKIEWQTLGLAEIILGLFPIIGVIIVDASVKRVIWSAPDTWIWLALFTSLLALGIWKLNEARKINNL
jgi:hypothetical protein